VLLAQIPEGELDLACCILMNASRDTDAAGLGQAFEAGGDIDAVAKDVAVLDDDVPLMDPDAKLDAAFSRQRSVAFG
jgi:hypothetical protein